MEDTTAAVAPPTNASWAQLRSKPSGTKKNRLLKGWTLVSAQQEAVLHHKNVQLDAMQSSKHKQTLPVPGGVTASAATPTGPSP